MTIVHVLVGVSWILFVAAALIACLSVGLSFSKGYVKAIYEAVNNARDLQKNSALLIAAESDESLKTTFVDQVLGEARLGGESLRRSVVEAFRTAEHANRLPKEAAAE
jgi:hypothetical protein